MHRDSSICGSANQRAQNEALCLADGTHMVCCEGERRNVRKQVWGVDYTIMRLKPGQQGARKIKRKVRKGIVKSTY